MERGFIGLDIAVLAVSDVASFADEAPAQLVVERLGLAGHRVIAKERVDDSAQLIKAKYLEWIADPLVDVVIVTSGAKSEAASEALAPLATKPLVGFADLFRYLTFEEIGTAAMLVDAAAAQCKQTFIFVLPSSIGAVRTALEKLLLPQLDYRTKPQNLVTRMARHHHGGGESDAAPAKTPWIVATSTKVGDSAPVKVAKRTRTEPGTPAIAASSRELSVSKRMSAVLEAAAPKLVTAPPPVPPREPFAAKESTDVGVAPPPTRSKVPTSKGGVPAKAPAQVTPAKSAVVAPVAAAAEPEELPASDLVDIAPAQIVDEPVAAVPIPEKLSTKVPTGPIRIEDESTREAIQLAQKRAATDRVTPIPLDERPRSVAIPARRKRDTMLIGVWAVIILASASLIVMVVISRMRERDAVAAAARSTQNNRVATLDRSAIPDAGVIEPAPTSDSVDATETARASVNPASDEGAIEPPLEPPTRTPDRVAPSPRPTPPRSPAKTTASLAPGCDEVSCVLERYKLACCARFKPASSSSPVRAGTPAKLDRAMVTAGIAKVKPAVIRCGETHSARGQVKLAVTVSPAGAVTEASVTTAPDAALGTCVAGAVRRATFAATAAGGSFAYPFVF